MNPPPLSGFGAPAVPAAPTAGGGGFSFGGGTTAAAPAPAGGGLFGSTSTGEHKNYRLNDFYHCRF